VRRERDADHRGESLIAKLLGRVLNQWRLVLRPEADVELARREFVKPA